METKLIEEVERGDIRNRKLSRASKVFAYSQISKAFQKGTGRPISPSDIEGVVEIKGHFLWFEFKTHGHNMPAGQQKLFTQILWGHEKFKSILLLCEHEKILGEHDEIQIPENIIKFQIRWHDRYRIEKSDWIDGSRLHEFCDSWTAAAERKNGMESVLTEFTTDGD